MKIYNVQNNINNANFSAKVHIGGKNNNIPNNIYANIIKKTKMIGRKDDSVLFYFEKPVEEKFEPQFENMVPVTQKYRKVFATSTINGHKEQKELGYCVFNKKLEDEELLNELLSAYLNNLHLKTQHIYSKVNHNK